MKYSGLILNDVSAAPGVCVTFFTQGCPHRCPGCHNPEAWEYDEGLEFTPEVLTQITEGLIAQGIHRDLCIMGGEPLCPENTFLTSLIIKEVKEKLPLTKIYVWTGYEYKDLLYFPDPHLKYILETIDCVIDGPYIQELRDVTLPMRGSSNQSIIFLKD